MLGTFDRAFCFGVLHHLSDGVAARGDGSRAACRQAGGVFVSIDPCHIPAQHVVAKLLIEHDRGEYVRDPAGFERIISSLGEVRTTIYNDLLRIPYTQIVMRVENEGDASQMNVAQVPG